MHQGIWGYRFSVFAALFTWGDFFLPSIINPAIRELARARPAHMSETRRNPLKNAASIEPLIAACAALLVGGIWMPASLALCA
jgi:hypothetical protein